MNLNFVKLQEMIKPNISNKSKNILGVDRVENNSCKEETLKDRQRQTANRNSLAFWLLWATDWSSRI